MSAPLPLVLLAAAGACLCSVAAQAAGGLLPPANNTLWPSLSARVTIQTAAVSPLSVAGLAEPSQGLRGGALLGDYVFAQPSFGSFRATSGVVFGAHGGAPTLSVSGLGPGSRLGLAHSQGGARPLAAQADGWQTSPYLGLGFSSPLGDSGFSLSADLGWVAEATGIGIPGGRAPLGVQGSDSQGRELRLSPLLQFGMRYTF